MNATTWRFDPLDTLFFRESRPHGAAGGSELASLFPPPARTVAGAVRTYIGESRGVNWAEFANDANHPLRQQIGDPDNLGPLAFSGPWLTRDRRRLYPAPLFLFSTTTGGQRQLSRLRIGSPVTCDLGTVALPELPPGNAGATPLESVWLEQAALETVLRGDLPGTNALVTQSDLYADEPRLGIARDTGKRTAANGMLYQTRHIRPKRDVAIEVDVSGVDAATSLPAGVVRLGGEGRMAAVTIETRNATLPATPAPTPGTTKGLILILLSPALLPSQRWLPMSFEQHERDGVHIWRGEIHGVTLTVHAAVIGKARREGGWDMAKKGPRPVKSLLPDGSVYYCTVDNGDIDAAIRALHGRHIGEDTAFGYGQLACGLWNRNEYPKGGEHQ